MTTHHLKIEERWYRRIDRNEKTAEIRLDDRDYQAGDYIALESAGGNGCRQHRKITHVLRGAPGLQPGYVVLSLADPRVDNLRTARDHAYDANAKLARTNAGLRGHITRLSNKAAE